MESAISIKGTREGLAIALGVGDIDAMLDELSRHLKQQGAFFRGGVVTLEVGQRSLAVQDLMRFQELLGQHAMVLRSISAADERTLTAASELGLRLAGRDRQGRTPDSGAAEPPAAEAMASVEVTTEKARYPKRWS